MKSPGCLKVIIAFSLLFSLNTEINCQKFSNEFLNLGVGARAHGMAGAVVAQGRDISAGYWNPAGLALLQDPVQFQAMHAEWFAGIAGYDYLSIGTKVGGKKSAFGSISLIRFGIDKIPNTLNLVEPDGSINYDNVYEFSAADYAGMLSYGSQIGSKNWYLGGTIKIVHRRIGRIGRSWGFGVDIGLLYNGPKFKFGFQGRDLTTTLNSWDFSFTEEDKLIFAQTGNSIPRNSTERTKPRLIVGFAYLFNLGEKSTLLMELDTDVTTDGERNTLISSGSYAIDPHFGAELGISNLVFVRGGIGRIQKVKDDLDPTNEIYSIQPNGGVGIRLGKVSIDYALTDIGNVADELLYSHIFSLTFVFNSKRDEN